MEVVLNLDDELRLAFSISVLHGSFSNVVASQLGGETLHELGKVVGVLVVVEEEVHVSKLVLEGETLSHGEVRADREEFHGLLDIGFVSEVVGDTEGKCVVVLNGETSGGKGGRKHSSLHTGSFSDTLKGLEGSENHFFLENFLENGHDDRGTSAITEELNGFDIGKVKLGKLNGFFADHGESVGEGLDNFFHFIAFDVTVEVLLVKEVINTNVSFSISSEDLSGLLTSFHNTHLASHVFHGVVSVLLVEFSSQFLHHGIIKVSSTKISI